MKRSAIGTGRKSLARGSTFATQGGTLKRAQPTQPRRRAISPASPDQRAKVKSAVCRECGGDHCHPAHVVDRSLGGCDDVLCVIPLCPYCHREYDEHRLDVLPLLNILEQAHAVSHVGIVSALERTTNLSWKPEQEAA